MTKKQIEEFRFHGKSIPVHMISAVFWYFNHHRRPGDFLLALLENDLMVALRRGDYQNLEALRVWGSFLHNEAPSNAYGSPEKVAAWLQEDA